MAILPLSVFREAFARVASVAPSRTTKEILQNVKLSVSGGTVTLYATDAETSLSVQWDYDGDAAEELLCLLPASRTGSILKEASGDTVEINATDAGVQIKTKSGKFKLPSANPAEMPKAKRYDELPVSMHSADLKALIGRTIFASDADSTRYALSGVRLEIEGGKMIAVSTDGRRLACHALPAEGVEWPENVLVPARAAELLQRILPDDEAISIKADGSAIYVQSAHFAFYARLLEGRFPAWRQVLPAEQSPFVAELLAGALSSAVKQAAVVTEHERRAVNITFGGEGLALSANTEMGAADIVVDADVAGDETTITLDHRFILDALRRVGPEEKVRVEYTLHSNPVLLRLDDGFRYVIMPMSRDA